MTRYVYLCGPITGKTFEAANDWRIHMELVVERLAFADILPGWQALSPLHDKAKYVVDINGPLPDCFEGGDWVADEDYAFVARSAVVLANFKGADRASIGSCFELGYALALGIPIIVIMDEADIHNHLFVRHAAWRIVRNEHEAVRALRDLDAQLSVPAELKAAA